MKDLLLSRKVLIYVLSVVVSILFIALILWTIGDGSGNRTLSGGVGTIVDTVLDLPIYISVLIFLGTAGITYVRAIRWKWLLQGGEENGEGIDQLTAVKLCYISWSINTFIPARLGDLLRILFPVRDKQTTIGVSTGSILSEKVVDVFGLLFVFTIFTALGTLFIEEIPTRITQFLFLVTILCAVGTLILWLLIRQKKIVQMVAKRAPKSINLEEHYTDFQNYWYSLLSKKFNMLRVFLATILVWCSEGVMLYIIVRALNIPISFVVLMIALSFSLFTYIVPITPGNIGLFEFAFASVVLILGGNETFALESILIYHVLSTISLSIVGIPLFFSKSVKNTLAPMNEELDVRANEPTS